MNSRLIFLLPWLLLAQAFATAKPLRVCATTPDLADLARTVGGSELEVTALVRSTEDPHFLEPRPSMIRELNRAEVLIFNGLELEIGWLPILVQQARNPLVQPNLPGWIDASIAVRPLEIPQGPVDRSQGDVHAAGNPHYLHDPVNGLRVARHLRDRFAELRPEASETFRRRCAEFETRLGEKLTGKDLAGLYDVEKLAQLQEAGALLDFLEKQGQAGKLAGWWGRFLSHRDLPVVADHNQWPYLARRCWLNIAGHLEPRPGVPPSARHLGEVVQRLQQEKIRLLIASDRFDRRHVDFVASRTGAAVALLFSQTGDTVDSGGYEALIEHNMNALLQALEKP